MRSLVYEDVQTFVLPAPVGVVSTPVSVRHRDVRPRLEGYEDALRGPALAAKLADHAHLVYLLRPQTASAAASLAALGAIQAILSIQTLPLLGGDVDNTGATGNPYFETDVSGQLMLFRGRISVDVQDWGVCRAVLTLTNFAAAAQNVLITTQILADVRVPQWERERLGTEVA